MRPSHHSEGNAWDFINTLVHLILPSEALEVFPQTFLFNEELNETTFRIWLISNDVNSFAVAWTSRRSHKILVILY
jgi:hypothetical protein